MNFGNIPHESSPENQYLALLDVPHDVVHDPADLVPTGAPAMLKLPGEPTSAAAARAFVRDMCADSAASFAQDAALLASELVTNSVRHARTGAVLVTVTRHGPATMRVAVADGGGRTAPCACQRADAEADTGRGLLILRAVAQEWGVRISATSCEVWFELREPGH
jgi:anti-sigma regulatory factor (Ser/Thr protein kinase)